MATIEADIPALVEAREIIAEFRMMIRRKAAAGLTPWTSAPAPAWLPRSVAASQRTKPRFGPQLLCLGPMGRPRARLPASSSYRRQMYGRGKIDLLQARLIGAE